MQFVLKCNKIELLKCGDTDYSVIDISRMIIFFTQLLLFAAGNVFSSGVISDRYLGGRPRGY